MDTYFVVRRGKFKIAVQFFIGFVFTLVGTSFALRFVPLLQTNFGPLNINLFVMLPVIFAIIGFGILLRTIYMVINNTLITADARYIRYLKESYPVNHIHRFEYRSYYSRGHDETVLIEELNIVGEDGFLRMDISSTNMKTRDLIELFRKYYPSIPLIVE